MFIKKYMLYCLYVMIFSITSANIVYAMGGGNTDKYVKNVSIEDAEKSNISMKKLADIYWIDSDSTSVQKEEILKNITGKSVTWEIKVAEIQKKDDIYLIQGQSDKDMIGTFSYVTAHNDIEKDALTKSKKGSILKISGVISDMQMRHIVLYPAKISTE